MTRESELPASMGEQAAEAWEAFNGGEAASAEKHREFAQWMARSPQHVEAYLRVARTMATLRQPATPWPDTSAAELIRAAKAAPGEVVALSRGEVPKPAPVRAIRGLQMRHVYALAASMVLAVCVSWFAWMGPERHETAFGEQRSVLLDDGSRVTLNTASKIEVELKKDRRIIRLLAGEALFEVAHDPSRPFDVYTGDSILRAVGTKFDIDMRPEHTTVTVVEGIVSLTQGLADALPLGNFPLLQASDRVVIGPSGPGVHEHGVRVDAVTAWMQRKLIFEHRALGEVAEEFNRYNRERIVIESDELRSEEISGVFQADDPASFVSFLSGVPGVSIRRDGQDVFVTALAGNATP